ncbi:polyamine-transporting ATPase 13A3-like [Daktulosphaira vitifoliae]|uniref:polyamine-transporting ATPase 13A3-like n=1 Tax=Daktulosphaira vitifoliae TaxID=58002 RepID=UPI0021AA0D4F|nr:polyamine-transporting ATPase 13A3-like [Daktulosphaira vitifoliae]XP_050526455.1 polyamine-transporting ATPase 13A3-like [Daktulosphaira vitifoliae]XP_050526456.1 polyamine-transporting ATPase 13A3-like [Daktulosphaira vitifoliae]XP_050526457.1 polyamine-transporting ATPase 13A3-like [Daktulosphaira vitifoliae]XP_050526458.1 polyamine-transporting ATPase 13A3-like [Daktulosphaira vitifoliae]XP_050526459.1 polyamine-transporting ATPase 13A3-like [Daktulosphaira vitifoliae]
MALNENCPKGAVFKQNGSSYNFKFKVNSTLKDKALLNADEEDEMKIFGYKRCIPLTILIWIFTILSLGFLRLLFHWWPHWVLYVMFKRCPLDEAERVLVVDSYEGTHRSYFVKKVIHLSIENINYYDNKVFSKGCNDSINAEKIQLKSEIKTIRIYLNDGSYQDVSHIRVINIKKISYVWCQSQGMFQKLVGLDRGSTTAHLHNLKGYSADEQFVRRFIYGLNTIDIPMQSIITLIGLEILNPLYIFQAFSFVVWLSEGYVYYLGAIVIMSLFGITSSVIQTRENQKTLRKTVHFSDKIVVCRRKEDEKLEALYEEISTTNLVPGDIIVIPRYGFEVPCDAALLCGSCVVNESMLTGESVPIVKTALPNRNLLYNEKEDMNHTLFSGTKVLQARYHSDKKILAVVLRTGFLTAKGSLVRSILYPPPTDFRFDKDSYRFIWILAIIAISGSIYTAITKASRGLTIVDIIVKSLDLLTIVIPPALPAAMTVGKMYALRRLQKYQISCINSRVINVSGSIDCICFDKTGTLTEDGLDMWGIVPIESSEELGLPLRNVSTLSNDHPLKIGMATCHSLTLLNSIVLGDPLDIKMFESTEWSIEEMDVFDTSKFDVIISTVVRPPSLLEEENTTEIGLIHQFHFSSSLQRMSMITKVFRDPRYVVYSKGSPEMIQSLCIPNTVPVHTNNVLRGYTEEGYRVIAIAYKVLEESNFVEILKLRREEVECDLIFAGLVILENRLKNQTTPVIEELQGADIKIVMLTGDNILTAVSVAKECGIVPPSKTIVDVTADERDEQNPKIYYTASGITLPLRSSLILNKLNGCDIESEGRIIGDYSFALTGRTWAIIRDKFPDLLPKILVKGAIFARMTSEHKQQLVKELQNIGYHVAMCGDGANDCGALRAAHVGVSLSEAESSVASPFTSHKADISCMPLIIRQGRAALVTSFGVFKFMVLYSLLEFTSTFILYNIDSNLTDFEFLFIDVGLVVNFMFFFGRNQAFKGSLFRKPPLTRLLSFVPLFSMVANLFVLVLTQILSFYLIQQFLWFKPFHFTQPLEYKCYENYAVYSISQFQYIILAFIFSYGKPYRVPIYKNKVFFFSLLTMTLVCTFITVFPTNWVKNILQLEYPPKIDFPILIIALAIVDCIVCLIIEYFIVDYLLTKKFKMTSYESNSEYKYQLVKHELDSSPGWPPICKHQPMIISSSLECMRKSEINTAQLERQERLTTNITKL